MTAASPGPAPGGAVDLRLLSYNVRSLRDDRHAVAAVIRACAPDVVCVQEAPRFLRWRARVAWLARASGLVVVTGGRTAAGNLVLASLRTRVRYAADARFSRSPGLHRRGAALAVLEVGGVRFGVAGVHLGLDADERRRHLDELAWWLDRLRAAGARDVVVAGDLNEPPGGPVWAALGRLGPGLRDAWSVAPEGGELTFSAARPRRRIDAVFAGPGLEVVGCGVPGGAAVPLAAQASDHLPLLARLRVHRSLP